MTTPISSASSPTPELISLDTCLVSFDTFPQPYFTCHSWHKRRLLEEVFLHTYTITIFRPRDISQVSEGRRFTIPFDDRSIWLPKAIIHDSSLMVIPRDCTCILSNAKISRSSFSSQDLIMYLHVQSDARK